MAEELTTTRFFGPSAESLDYVQNKGEFHLFSLLTEERHRATWDLSYVAQGDVGRALAQILSVDADIERRLDKLAAAPEDLQRAVSAVQQAILEGRRIYVYGCGATGRLAKQVESSFWRPFFAKLRSSPSWPKLADLFGNAPEERLVGEMTGADRALVASLEGFEDLQLLGQLQLQDHGIQAGDVVFCVTEGGETSSVIGTILAARAQYAEDAAELARDRLFFLYNNPDERLRPFERSRRVLDEVGITKICLATGPQALAGSTRMQATTIETFVLGLVLEDALDRVLAARLTPDERATLGFAPGHTIAERLADFGKLRAAVERSTTSVAAFTKKEGACYRAGQHTSYFANRALVTVFTDCTERSPTFRLFPLDQVGEAKPRSWVRVCTQGESQRAAWSNFLGRPFRGLVQEFYGPPLRAGVQDEYLRRAALSSLDQAGQDQEANYDFSLGGPALQQLTSGDLAVVVLLADEATLLTDPTSSPARFVAQARDHGADLVFVHVSPTPATKLEPATDDLLVALTLHTPSDPLAVRQHVALKILLNAHSTACMATLGRLVGNTMTNVSPSNLKLIGRATHLIQSHCNDLLQETGWSPAVPFAVCNAVLFDAMKWARDEELGETAEVALSIVRILETLRSQRVLPWTEAAAILSRRGLADYLREIAPPRLGRSHFGEANPCDPGLGNPETS